MNKTEYRTLVLDGWSPPEETRRRENYIEELENRIECPQCGRLLQPKTCLHCEGDVKYTVDA